MEQRVVTKLIVVVQVFIAEREGEHALADQGLDRVLEQSWVAPVGETAGHPTDQPEAAIQPPQQQPSGIRCDDSAIEPGHNLVPFNRFKFEQCWATLCLHRGLSGIAVSDWRIAIFRDSPHRCIKGFEKSGLDELARRHDGQYILMIYDGAPCHSPGALNIPDTMTVRTLPPYSPQLNRVENIWDDMREKFFANIVFESMDAVENKISEACLHYEENTETVRSITAFPWIADSL